MEALVDEALELQAAGLPARSNCLHRQNVRDDLAAAAAVAEVLDEDVLPMVDANQNNFSEGYPTWSRLDRAACGTGA